MPKDVVVQVLDVTLLPARALTRHREEVAPRVVVVPQPLAVGIDHLEQAPHGVVGGQLHEDGRRLARRVRVQRADGLSCLAEDAVEGLHRAGFVRDLDEAPCATVRGPRCPVGVGDLGLRRVLHRDEPIEIVAVAHLGPGGPVVGLAQPHAVAHQVERLLDEPCVGAEHGALTPRQVVGERRRVLLGVLDAEQLAYGRVGVADHRVRDPVRVLDIGENLLAVVHVGLDGVADRVDDLGLERASPVG